MATPEQGADTPFIFTNGMGKAEPDKRKLIRKHVMLGKNRGKTRNGKAARPASPPGSDDLHGDQQRPSGLLVKMHYADAIPKKVGSELSFTRFATTIEPHLVQDLLKFSFIAKRVMYPLESCLLFHRKDEVDNMWFKLLTCDAAYLHAVIFVSQAYFFLASGEGTTPAESPKAMMHHSTTLRLLRERLSARSDEDAISDGTILVVLNLAGHAYFMNDYDSARHHMQGLRKMVDMRGGLGAFSYNTKLVMELIKCDLAMALNHGTELVFFQNPALESLAPYDLAAEELASSQSELSWRPPSELKINAELSRAWAVLRRFCSTVNSAAEHNRRLPKEAMLNAMASAMYRLLRMNGLDPCSVDEAVRLGLLAVSSHIFLRWRDVELPHTRFPQVYRSCLLNLRIPAEGGLPPQVLLWLLMAGAASLFGPGDEAWLAPWLRVNIELCGALSWGDLRGQLRQFPWVGFLHDRLGRAMFESAMSSVPGQG